MTESTASTTGRVLRSAKAKPPQHAEQKPLISKEPTGRKRKRVNGEEVDKQSPKNCKKRVTKSELQKVSLA